MSSHEFLDNLCRIAAGECASDFLVTINQQVKMLELGKRQSFREQLVLSYVSGRIYGLQKQLDQLTATMALIRAILARSDMSDREIIKLAHDEALEAVPYE